MNAREVIAGLALAGLALTTGCGSSRAQDAKNASGANAKPAAVPSAEQVPVAKVGVPLHLQLPATDGSVRVDLTLTGVKLKGKQMCVGLKLKNADTKPLVDPGLSWTWYGTDGRQADTGPGTSDQCDELGDQWAGLDQPTPQPGHYVTGYYGFTVPGKSGKVEFTDSDETPLFDVTYPTTKTTKSNASSATVGHAPAPRPTSGSHGGDPYWGTKVPGYEPPVSGQDCEPGQTPGANGC